MIQLRALGVLDLRTGDDAQIKQVLAQPKRAALLTYLLLATHRGSTPHARDSLLALFWPDQPPEQARNALSQAVHFLRRALGDGVIVSHDGDSIGAAAAAIWCDTIAFDDAVRQGRVEEALDLYRGDFLDGFHVANAPDFERWLDAERQRLGDTLDATLETMATRCEQQGDYAGALSHRRRLAARAPYNSAIALRLIRTLAQSGDAAAAVQHALVHEKLLRSEFDIALPRDIAALVAEIQARPSVPATARSAGVEPSRQTSRQGSPEQQETEPAVVRTTVAPPSAGARRVRVVMLAAVLVTACVGVGYALVTRDTADAHLMELYRRGESAELNRSQVGLQTAAQYYRLAIARDSTFAPGYAGLSFVYTHLAFYDFAPRTAALDSARILAHRAVALDSSLPEAKTALAVSLANSGHFGAAGKEFRAAIALDPGKSKPRIWYGMLLVGLGRGNDALAQVDTALQVDPMPPRAASNVRMQATYIVTGTRPHLRLPHADRRQILKAEPGEPWARGQQAVELAEEGRCEDARSELATAQRLVPESNRIMMTFVALVDWSCGDQARARAALARMKQRPDADDQALRVAVLHTRFGEKDSAFVWLRRQRWALGGLAMLGGNPWLDPLRADPAFPEFLRSIGVRE